MPEDSIVLRILRSAKCKKWLHVTAIVFGFVCIGGCFVLASLTYILFGDCEDCSPKQEDQDMVKVMRIMATVLFLLGILLIALSLCCKGTENSLAPQVVVSAIPAADLEKSPAPVLANNLIPHRLVIGEEAATNLPAVELTATVINNIDEASNSSLPNDGFWTEDIGPITPPPAYEEVMLWPAIVVVKPNSSQSDSIEDTGL